MRFSTLLLALVAPLTAPHADVLVVDDDGGSGVDHVFLQDAVDAAQEGDVLLLRPGDYPPPFGQFFPTRIAGKSLTVVGDGPVGSVRVPGLQVRDLAAGQEVLVRKIDLVSGPLRVTDNAGTVWLEAVTGVAQNFTAASPPLVVERSDAVHVNRCELRGAQELLSPFVALHAVNSAVSLYDTDLEGASGYAIIQTGADAALVEGGTLFAAGCTFLGGGGGCSNDALELTGGAEATTRDCTFTPGTPADCIDGLPPGVGVHVVDGSHVPLAGAARSLRVATPGAVGGAALLVFSGEPGDLVVLNVATSLGSAYLPPIGTLQLDLPLAALVALGTADAAGELQLPLALPPTGQAALLLPLQVTALAGPELVLTGGSALVITDL